MPSRKQSSAGNFVKFVLSVMCKLLFRPNASHYQLQPETVSEVTPVTFFLAEPKKFFR